MAPTRLATKPIAVNENLNGILSHGITTRSKQLASLKNHKDILKVPNKRKADSPLKDATAKRAAFGDITNAFNKSCAPQEKDKVMVLKKVMVETKMLPTVKNIKPTNTTVHGKTSKTKSLQRVATNAIESMQKHFAKDPPKPIPTRAQNGILKNIEKKDKTLKDQNQSQNSAKSARSDMSEPSLYTTALENISPSEVTKEAYKTISEKLDKVNLDDSVNRSLDDETETPHAPPAGVPDFDVENWNDPFQVSHYAMDIFNYLKGRENSPWSTDRLAALTQRVCRSSDVKIVFNLTSLERQTRGSSAANLSVLDPLYCHIRLFPIDDYLSRMKGITSWMRALLVDWMVEVQESFELNHETLYLAVKLVDLFLTRSTKRQPIEQHLTKEELQLLGAAALFISSKFDERIPPLVDDFLYICDGAYTLSQLLKMEMNILKVVDFDLGIPLSYRFLRRYARCARVSMPTLTLARFVLEQCLLEYGLIEYSDSKMAAAALYLALRMKSLGHWTNTLQYYTGYCLKDILPTAVAQNAILHKKPKSAISTVRNKYSHTIFFEVAKVPLIDDSVLSS